MFCEHLISYATTAATVWIEFVSIDAVRQNGELFSRDGMQFDKSIRGRGTYGSRPIDKTISKTVEKHAVPTALIDVMDRIHQPGAGWIVMAFRQQYARKDIRREGMAMNDVGTREIKEAMCKSQAADERTRRLCEIEA